MKSTIELMLQVCRVSLTLAVAYCLIAPQPAICGEKESPIPVVLNWNGEHFKQDLSALPQFATILADDNIKSKFGAAESRLIQDVVGLPILFPKANSTSILENNFIVGMWPVGKDETKGSFLAIQNLDEKHPFITSVQEMVGIPFPKIEKGEKKSESGISEKVSKDNKSWVLGRYKSWIYVAQTEGGSVPHLDILDACKSTCGDSIMSLSLDAYKLPGLNESLNLYFNNPIRSVRLHASIANSNIKIEGEATLTKEVNKLSEWKLPLSDLRDPVTSFTAVRGLSKAFETINKSFGNILPESDQLILAGEFHGHLHYVMRCFLPVANMNKSFGKSKEDATKFMNAFFEKNPIGKLAKNDMRLSWTGLPIIVPYLRGLDTTNNGGFLELGVLPLKAEPKPVPQALVDQIIKSEKTLLYDWELTRQRATQLSAIYNIFEVLKYTQDIRKFSGTNGKDVPRPPNAVEANKIIAILCGDNDNAITQFILAEPNKIKIQRNSKIGISAIEIVFLSRFLTR